MTAFAYYRLPYLHHAHYVAQREGEPEVLSSVAELNGKEGFVIAPFSPSSDCPVLLIHPDESKLLPISDAKVISISDSAQGRTGKDADDVAGWNTKGETLPHHRRLSDRGRGVVAEEPR